MSCLLIGCAESTPKNTLEAALTSNDERIKRVMENLDKHELQLRFTRVHRDGDSIGFVDYDFQVDSETYFYPASTVKFPAAVAALEKLNSIDSIDRNTPFFVEGDTVKTTIARAIEEIFAVSDNAANNRLVEFLGFDGLNRQMQLRGVAPFRISHRLSIPNADALATMPLVFYTNDSMATTYAAGVNSPPKPLILKAIKKGEGFYANDSLIYAPFDFSLKNHYPIKAQSALLKRVLFPEAFAQEQQFDLTKDQLDFLAETMAKLPRELGYPPDEFYDGYVKFFLFGDTKDPIPPNVKIYNKVGYAYGTLTDCAYIKDEENNIEFMLIATILVNQDGVFNDNAYEYEEVGIPFLAQLGREVYTFELARQTL